MEAKVTSNAARMAYDFARSVQSEARRLAPAPPPTVWPPAPSGYVRTGHLRSSIKAKKVGTGHWKIEVGAPYGIYVEYGTRYMRAEPFFRPAIEKAKRDFRTKFGRIFR